MDYTAVLVLCFLPLLTSSYYVKVGILSDDPDTSTTSKVWSLAQNYSTMMSLEPVVKVTRWWAETDAPAIARSVCSLSEMGVDALVYLGPPRWNYLVASYSDHLGLPFVAAMEMSGFSSGKYQVNILPDTMRAAADFLRYFKWNKFSFIYELNYGPNQLQSILQTLLTENFVVEVEAFWRAAGAGEAFQYINQLLQPNVNRRLVLATSEQFADELMARLARGKGYSILLLTPVGAVQRSYYQGFYQLTKLSAIELEVPILKTLENRLKTIPSYTARGRTGKAMPDSVILHYEASSILNTMFNQIAREQPEAMKPRQNMNCIQDGPSHSETADYLRRVIVEHGVTGKIEFDQTGSRQEFKINVIQVTQFDIQKVGTWTDSLGLQIAPNFSKDSSVPMHEAYKSEPPLRVTSIQVSPFLNVSPEGKFSGFVKDFLDALSIEVKRDFKISLVKDQQYGRLINGVWTGMIGELIREEADLVVSDLTKTVERGKVIDFGKSFITFGLNILVKKGKTEVLTFGPFTFLTVWPPEVWLVIVALVLLYSGTGYGISRFIGAPDRIRALETKGTEKLSPCGSVWLTLGSLFCRDTGIYPRNFTHRLWAILWWIVCIFVAFLYISMLTAELIKSRNTIVTTHSKKTSQELLKEALDTGTPEIGAVASGSTISFFIESRTGLYSRFGRYLRENPQVLAMSYSQGIERVRNSSGDYAFVMESTSSQLVINSKPCDTLATSGFLDTKSFAVALQKNSTIKELIDHGVLSLMESGTLRKLYEKWWHNVPSECEDPNLDLLPKIYSNSMTLYEVSGLFYLLIGLTLLSIIAAVIEYYFKTKQIVME